MNGSTKASTRVQSAAGTSRRCPLSRRGPRRPECLLHSGISSTLRELPRQLRRRLFASIDQSQEFSCNRRRHSTRPGFMSMSPLSCKLSCEIERSSRSPKLESSSMVFDSEGALTVGWMENSISLVICRFQCPPMSARHLREKQPRKTLSNRKICTSNFQLSRNLR